MRGMTVGRVFLFFSFTFQDVYYPCALVHWYSTVGSEPDKDTGLWVVKPEYKTNGHQRMAIVHLDIALLEVRTLLEFMGLLSFQKDFIFFIL